MIHEALGIWVSEQTLSQELHDILDQIFPYRKIILIYSQNILSDVEALAGSLSMKVMIIGIAVFDVTKHE